MQPCWPGCVSKLADAAMATKLHSVTLGYAAWEALVLVPAEQLPPLTRGVCIPKGALSLRRPGQNSRGASRSKISRQPSLCGCLRGEQSVISRLIGLTVELLDTAKPECVLLACCSIPFTEFCVWELRARPKLCALLQQTCTAPPPSRAGFSGPGLGRVRLCIFPGSNSAKNRNVWTLLH